MVEYLIRIVRTNPQLKSRFDEHSVERSCRGFGQASLVPLPNGDSWVPGRGSSGELISLPTPLRYRSRSIGQGFGVCPVPCAANIMVLHRQARSSGLGFVAPCSHSRTFGNGSHPVETNISATSSVRLQNSENGSFATPSISGVNRTSSEGKAK